ncbi:unnamed protein product [marine sediment metagenome]|uniref:Uncharacterized protein n=1 Tax=marine sediment metagenome TaxID=412755 RepID=X0ZCN9_9ZZZZ
MEAKNNLGDLVKEWMKIECLDAPSVEQDIHDLLQHKIEFCQKKMKQIKRKDSKDPTYMVYYDRIGTYMDLGKGILKS